MGAFEWIEGRPPPRTDLQVARSVGHVLALAHDAPIPESLAGTPRLRDFADTIRWSGLSLRSCLPTLWRLDRGAAEVVNAAITAVESKLETLPRSEPVVVHGDLHPWNVLVNRQRRGSSTGHFARSDEPMADLGVPYRAWPEAYAEVLHRDTIGHRS